MSFILNDVSDSFVCLSVWPDKDDSSIYFSLVCLLLTI